jgi:hypothetical protein
MEKTKKIKMIVLIKLTRIEFFAHQRSSVESFTQRPDRQRNNREVIGLSQQWDSNAGEKHIGLIYLQHRAFEFP